MSRCAAWARVLCGRSQLSQCSCERPPMTSQLPSSRPRIMEPRSHGSTQKVYVTRHHACWAFRVAALSSVPVPVPMSALRLQRWFAAALGACHTAQAASVRHRGIRGSHVKFNHPTMRGANVIRNKHTLAPPVAADLHKPGIPSIGQSFHHLSSLQTHVQAPPGDAVMRAGGPASRRCTSISPRAIYHHERHFPLRTQVPLMPRLRKAAVALLRRRFHEARTGTPWLFCPTPLAYNALLPSQCPRINLTRFALSVVQECNVARSGLLSI
jgi:hypothetical protein